MKLFAKSVLALTLFVFSISISNAKVEVLNSTNTTMTILYTPELLSMHTLNIGGEQYAQPIFDEARDIMEKEGYPQLIALTKPIAVPSPVGFEITNVEVGPISSKNSIMAPIYILGEEQNTEIDKRAYVNRPVENWASLDYSGISRDKHIALLNIIAAKYNPISRSIEIPKFVKVTISFNNNVKNTKANLFNKSKLNKNLLNANIANNWTISDEQLFFKNDIEKRSKDNKIQAEEVLSSGKWFKIKLSETGVYELTSDYLKDFGITIPKDQLNTIKIFGNGGQELPANVDFAALNKLNQQPITVRSNTDGSLKSVVFFGAGPSGFEYTDKPSMFTGKKVLHYINHFSKTTSYLITWGGDEGLRRDPTPKVSGPIVNDLKTHTRRVFFEEDLVNAFHSGSGKQFFGRTYFSEPFEQNLVNVADEGTMQYNLMLGQMRADTFPGYYSVSDNGKPITEKLTIPSTKEEAVRNLYEITIPISQLPNKNKSIIKLEFSNPNHPGANGFFDYYELNYTSKNIADNGQLYLFTDPNLSGLTKYNFTGFNGDIFAYDISDIGNPVQLQANSTTNFDLITDLTPNEPKRFYMASSLKKPITIESIDFKNLRSAKFNNDVILVTHNKLKESAKKYKEYREANSNLTVGIFYIDDIFNEYNAGTMDVTAIRDFISQAMINWDKKPEYLLLWGDGHYDYRGINTERTNYVPPYESDDELNHMKFVYSSSTDDYYARVVGDDRAIDIANGRITINSEEEGFKIIEKIKHYEHNSNIGNWRTKITLVADDGFSGTETGSDKGDGSLFVDDSEEFAQTRLPDYYEQKKIYSVEYQTQYTAAGNRKPGANAEILNSVNQQGALLLNWYGHGNPQVWSHEAILDRDVTIRQMTNLDKLFFLTAATCDFAKFDNFDSESGAEMMLLNEYGGAIGVFAATRVVYASQNHSINRAFYKELFTRHTDGTYPTLGQVMFDLKQTFNGTNDEKYFLLGDPTVTLLIPFYDVSFDEINGVSITDTTEVTVKGLQTVKLKGHIKNPNVTGGIATDFNGRIKVKVLDGDLEIKVVDVIDRSYYFTKQGGTLSDANFEVINGEFEAQFILPKDISFSENNGRIFSFAYTEDEKFAKGSFNDLKIDGLALTSISDNQGPQIDIKLDSRKFKAGDIVRPEPLLIVDLQDDSGINSTGIGVGHKIEAWIDGGDKSIDLTYDYESSFEDFRKGTALKNLLGLNPGAHTIKVRAWDIFNNFSTAETYFNITEDGDIILADVTAAPTPFETNTKITFKHNLNPPLDVQLDIFDAKGMKVNTLNTKVLSPYEGSIDWQGDDFNGTPVSIGSYYFRLKLNNLNANETFLKGRTIKIK